MIKTEKINGFEVQYTIVEPSRVDVEFSIGSSVKQLGTGHEVAINFPYADIETGTPIGMVVVDGKTVISDVEKTKNRDLLYGTKSGEVHIGQYPTATPQWAVKGSPRLLRDGRVVVEESLRNDKTPSDIADRKAVRTAVGLKPDGSVVLVVTQMTMYLDELAGVMLKLGCIDALNGDGGGSSYLWPEDNGWGRKLGAAIVVKKEEVKRMKIVIDAGHGPQTPGKRCPDDSMREYSFNSATANHVVSALKGYENVEILTTYEDSRDVPLQERTDKANAWGANAFVSIHANASGNDWSTAHGIETFTYTTPSSASVALAVAVHRNLIKSTGLDDRGVKKDNLHVLRETNMPAILVECGFMTNHTEAALLKSDTYRQKCADAIVKGLVETYGLKKKEEPVKMPTKPQDASLPIINGKVDVSVNGGPNTTGYLIDGVTFVPVRLIAETFGATVDWNNGTPVKITKEAK